MRYQPDSDALSRFLRSRQAQDVCQQPAQNVARTARTLAARRSKTGTLARSIRARPSITLAGRRRDRLGWDVIALAPYAAQAEFGGTTRNGTVVVGQHFLRRALETQRGS